MEDTFPAEPFLVPDSDGELSNLVFDLLQKSAVLAGSLCEPVRMELGRLVRSMNCYYSNLIEGHQTHPRDIERALANEFLADPAQRDLQREARAHIDLQARIDAADTISAWPASGEYVKWLHREFCSRLPDEMLWVENSRTGVRARVEPGAYRDRDVEVGMHTPPTSESLQRFMARFDEAYDPRRLNKAQQLISAAAAHHRLLWIHPFLDGNGRVARLMSHALLLKLGVGSSLWSVARGLARRVDEYKSALANADAPRKGDLDGRGSLSLSGLKDFCAFFLSTCIDQVDFMQKLLEPSELLRRIEIHVSEETAARRLPRGSFEMLRETFYQGEVPRGRAPEITGYEERRARETLSVLLEKGFLIPSSPKGPVRMGFPSQVWERWLPSLYPIDTPRQ